MLVVDDNIDAAESLRMLLEIFGHQVRVARDGPTALELACADVPEVMLVDIGLPGMDGCEVARGARRIPSLREVWLVAFTGYGSDEDRQRTLGAGFDLHLTKPVDPANLRELLTHWTVLRKLLTRRTGASVPENQIAPAPCKARPWSAGR